MSFSRYAPRAREVFKYIDSGGGSRSAKPMWRKSRARVRWRHTVLVGDASILSPKSQLSPTQTKALFRPLLLQGKIYTQHIGDAQRLVLFHAKKP